MKGIALNPAIIILFVVGAIIAIAALQQLVGSSEIPLYYSGVQNMDNNSSVPQLLVLLATWMPVGIFIAILVYFFKIK